MKTMSSFEQKFYRNLHWIRRLTQWAVVVFIFVVPFLNRQGIHAIIGTFYSIRIGHLDLMDPALMFQTILLTQNIYFPAILAGSIPIILALVFGRVFCSWMCPYNLLSEYVGALRKRVFPKKQTRILNHNPRPHWYWTVLGSIVTLLMVSGLPVITYLSMPGLISSQVADLVLHATIGVEISLVIILLLIEFFFAPHFWCKYACPVGAVLTLFHYKHTMRVQFDPKGCTCQDLKALSCNAACPLGLDPRHRDIYPYCYNCGECIYACHKHQGKSLSFSFQTNKQKNIIPLKFNEKQDGPFKEANL